MSDTALRNISRFIAMGLVYTAMGAIIGYPVMLLWNGCLVPAVEGCREITWLQGWGIMILAGLLFNTKVSNKD